MRFAVDYAGLPAAAGQSATLTGHTARWLSGCRLPTNFQLDYAVRSAVHSITQLPLPQPHLAVPLALHLLIQQLQHLGQWVAARAWGVSQPHVEGGPSIKGVTAHLEGVGGTTCMGHIQAA